MLNGSQKFISFAIVVMFFLSIEACSTMGEHSSTKQRKKIISWNKIKWCNVERQAYDYSCGSAALATIINGYFGDQTTEDEIITGVTTCLSEEELIDRMKNGLSLLDLKKQAQRMGYMATGIRLKPNELFNNIEGPVLVLLKDHERHHFTIFRGVRNERVYLADSARGNMRMSIPRFLEEWDGNALVLGKEDFGIPIKYKLDLTSEGEDRAEIRAIKQVLSR